MGSSTPSVQSAAAYAAQNVRHLVASQHPLASRPAGPPGRTRPAEACMPISAAFMDHMNAARAELAEHVRDGHPAAPEPSRPVPVDLAAAYELIGRQNEHLEPARRLVREALLYRQGLEHALYARRTEEIRCQHCPSCGCLSLYWRWEFRAAICLNPDDFDAARRPRRFTLQRIAEKAVEDLTMRVATS